MPRRRAALALAGGLFAGLPILLCAVVAPAQEQPPWQQRRGDPRDQPQDEAYRPPQNPPGGDPRAYGDNRDPYRSGRQDDAYPPRYGEPAPRSDDTYRPPRAGGDVYSPPPRTGDYSQSPAPYGQPYTPPGSRPSSGPGEPYSPPRSAHGEPTYSAPGRYDGPYGPRPYQDDVPDGSYSSREILNAGHGFFGSISKGLASVVEYAFQRQGRPNGYILGQDAGGAFVAGLRYGEGILYTKDAGSHRVYWQGPSIGYDAGAEGSKVMVLVYNMRDPGEIYQRFGGIDGSAYFIGGVGLTFQRSGDLVVAPIRAGIGLRLGANVGYLKYTRSPTWNPF